METLKLDLDNAHSVGLGDNLCLISLLTNLPVSVELCLNNEFNAFDKFKLYKRLFRIPDSQLKLTLVDSNGTFNGGGYWPAKLLYEYHRPKYVNVFGQLIELNKGDKKCIALVTQTQSNPGQDDMWPWCRSRTPEYWGRIFVYLKGLGYEVITLDHPHFDLETKVELLAKHCKAIISYEGGMAHLAHMLKLPCFLVDWKLPSPSTPYGQYHCEMVHRTDSVHILRDDEEIFLLNKEQFDTRISELQQGLTNNRFANGEFTLSFAGPGVHGEILLKDKTGKVVGNLPPMYGSNQLTDLLSKYYT